MASVAFVGQTELTVDISITPTAQTGSRTVELTNPSGAMATGTFEVTTQESGIIAVDSVEPAEVEAGQEVELVVFGVGFQEGVDVLVRGGGVVVNDVRRVSATQLTVQVSITSTAAGGERQLVLTNPDGTTASGTFSITSGVLEVGPGETLIPTGITRVRPQVIASGIDPIIIDRSDTQLEFIAIVRPGALPVERVTFSQNTGAFSFTLQPSQTLSNGDVIYRAPFSFERGRFGVQVLDTAFGPNPDQFNFTAIDVGEQRHSFPDIEFGNTPLAPTSVPVPVLVDETPGVKRVRPQVLAAGIDPILIDTNSDTSVEFIALVRPGAVPISQVTFSENRGPFSVVLQAVETLPNGDAIYRGRFDFARGSFGTTVMRAVFGPQTGQFNFIVIDEAQQRHAFPNLTFGDFPALP